MGWVIVVSEADGGLTMSRQEVSAFCRTLLEKGPVFLDTETTGLGPLDEVCEVAVVDASGVALFDELVRPTVPIGAGAARVHGITDEMVGAWPDFIDVLPRLAYELEDRVVIVYNAAFDLRLLEQSAKAHGQDLYCHLRLAEGSPWCAMEAYAEWWGDWSECHGNYRWQKLGDAMRQQGLSLPENLHRAAADAECTRRLVVAMGLPEEVGDAEAIRRWDDE